MPANLPPTYYAAEERYREASSNDEKIRILEEMLAIMPKHKGTDHLQADLRGKISRLKKEGEKKRVVSRFNPYAVEREDCPQVMIVGSPNSGKSSLINALTGAANEVADYPYTTVKPEPGILRGDNFRFQLVDLPPVMSDTMEGWMGDLLRHSDGIMLVFDVSKEVTLERMENVFKAVDRANIFIGGKEGEEPPLGTIRQNSIVVLSKIDSVIKDVYELIKSELDDRFTIIESSVVNGIDIKGFSHKLADAVKYMRIYTKIPGKKADMVEPYMVPQGITVIEMANVIHRDIAESFKYARIWSEKTYDGQRVGKDHILSDQDIIEVH